MGINSMCGLFLSFPYKDFDLSKGGVLPSMLQPEKVAIDNIQV